MTRGTTTLPLATPARPSGIASDKAYACKTDGVGHTPRICDRGYRCNTTTNIATACPAGTSDYRQGISSDTICPVCPKGYFNPLTAQTFCPFQCPSGTYGLYEGATNDTACGDCPKGHYCAGNAVVNPEPCPAGTYRTTTSAKSLSECISCTAGKYSNTIGAFNTNTCLDCPTSRPTSPVGASSESQCTGVAVCSRPSGLSSDLEYACSKDGTTFTPRVCDRGHRCNPATHALIECPIGTSDYREGQSTTSECPKCAKGYFNPLTAQTICPFTCSPGTYGVMEGGTNETAYNLSKR